MSTHLSRSPPGSTDPVSEPAVGRMNSPGRRRHPKKDVEAALRYAEAAGWSVIEGAPGTPLGAAAVPGRHPPARGAQHTA